MTRKLFVALCIVVSPAVHARAISGPESPNAMRLDVLFYDGTATLGDEQDVLHEEVERILFDSGISLRWLVTHRSHSQRDSKLPLRAWLLDREPEYLGLHRSVMGATTVTKSEEPYVFLFYPAILRTLEISRGSELYKAGRVREQIARAIARVLVHEIVHLLAPRHPHARRGLMRSRITRGTLMARYGELDPGSRMALVAGLERQRLLVQAN